jgi:hypothetical protein
MSSSFPLVLILISEKDLEHGARHLNLISASRQRAQVRG